MINFESVLILTMQCATKINNSKHFLNQINSVKFIELI